MIENNCYVYKKEVDWSVLHQGVSIPVTIQIVFHNSVNKFLPRGQATNIYLVLEGKSYKVKLVNQKFDERKYPGRSDILQIRYNPQSEIAERLRVIFAVSYRYISGQRNRLVEGSRKYIRVPEDLREYLAIYTTEYPDTYLLECITQEDTRIIRQTIAREDEQEYEASINYNIVDPDATISTVPQITKIRKLNRAIGETLKYLYNYSCAKRFVRQRQKGFSA
jgi:5-methylcytosine-specific restriction protein A